MKSVNLILSLIFFISANKVNACVNKVDEQCNEIDFEDVKEDCCRLIRNVHQYVHIWEWPDSFVKDMLKEGLENYLMVELNTPESCQLYAKYEAVDWNIYEMMKIHLHLYPTNF
jgi:hypothetical protein